MGASTAVFGLVGSYVSFIAINYNHLSQNSQKFCQIVMFLFLALFLTIMLGSKNVDVLGHLGGFMTGIVVGLWTLPCLETDNVRKARAKTFAFYAKIGTAVWFAFMLILFFTVRDPQQVFPTTTDAIGGTEKEATLPGTTNAVEDEPAADNTPNLSQTQTNTDSELNAYLDNLSSDVLGYRDW